MMGLSLYQELFAMKGCNMDYETKEYKCYQIRAHRDQDSFIFDPSKDDCGFPPCIRWVHEMYHAKIESFGFDNGFGWDDVCRLVKPKHARTKSQRENLCAILDVDYQQFLDERSMYYGDDVVHTFVSWYHDQRRESPCGWRDAIQYFDDLEVLCKIVELPVFNYASNGYNQGDSMLVMAVATEKWRESVGVRHGDGYDCTPSLHCSVETYCSWAWGDVYGYTIHEIIRDDDGDEVYEDTNESCWGYFGSDHNDSGLWQSAMEMIDYLVIRDQKEKEEKESCECRDIVTI
jgi:hypothetical protein